MTVASNNEARIIQSFINEHLDPACHICGHCSAQIRLGFNRVKDWYNIHKEGIEQYAANGFTEIKKSPGRPKTK